MEGIARDSDGRFYLCEEVDRWILRCDPATTNISRLLIEWSLAERFFSPKDANASFEGIAVGNGKLYVANERSAPRILVVDLKTLRLIDNFVIQPATFVWGELHYSDLSWFEGALFILARHHRVILKVDPDSHRVLAEYNYREMESGPEAQYITQFPTGVMEGLAVQADYFWLVTDNNGLGRVLYPKDIRPTLFKCPRPDTVK